jgi:5-methylcytosine-specific restriction endonuclease McrA
METNTKKQQLSGKLKKSTPTDTSLICSSESSGLNREETLGVQSQTLPDNDLKENHSRHAGNSDLRVQNVVYVLNMRGKPLMPTTQQKANKLLKQNKAKVVKRIPFTIQLKYATGETKQKITLGIDSGYKFVGFSAVTDEKEVISGELTLRTDVSKKIQTRAMYRRTRRGKLWHRKPRFDNRKRKEGWLAPSIQHKLDSHLRLIQKIKEILPISNVIVEVASFDQQKMQNPEISGIDYQQGELQGYEIREYLLEKWGRKCAYCGKKGIPLEIEHIIPKSRGGSGRVSNLTISCKKCNLKKGTQTAEEFGFPNIQKKAKESLKATVFMNVVRTRIVTELDCEYTYGYITKHHRIKQKISKSHSNDAFVIAKGTNQQRTISYICRQTRRNNRSLQKNRKGFKIGIRRQRYDYHPKDLVKIENVLHVVKCVHNLGTRVVISSPDSLKKSRSVAISKVKLVEYGSGIQFMCPQFFYPLKKVVSSFEGGEVGEVL